MKRIALLLTIIATTACDASHSNTLEEKIAEAPSPFDMLWEKAKNGGDIDCASLVVKKISIPPSTHMKEHGYPPETLGLLDYIYFSANDFRDIGVCKEEIGAAIDTLCEDVNKIIADTKKQNNSLLSDSEMSFGYSLSKSTFHFCRPKR
jgi:hypothetical protein